MGVQSLLKVIDDLSDEKQQRIFEHLQSSTETAERESTLKMFRPDELNCPDCESEECIKNGKRAGRQRFRCKDCGRQFTEFTGTPLEKIQKPLSVFVEFMRLVNRQCAIREIADKLNLSTKTVFKWRKKVMQYFAKLHKEHQLSGIVEVDETYILHSEKGNKDLDRRPRKRGGSSKYRGLSRDQDCILTAKDRSGRVFVKKVGRARPSFDEIDGPLSTHIVSDSVLCTDGMNAYDKFSREYGVERKNVKDVDEQPYHIQGINSLHHEIKEWLRSFRGIASRYIDAYLGFFAYRRQNLQEASV